MAKPTISNGRQWAFETHWKLGAVIDSGEISWQVLKFSCSFIHITHTNVFIFLNQKYTLPLPLWNTHTLSLAHTQSTGPGGVVSARSCSLLSWVQLVTWAACLNNSVIPKASSLQRHHGPVPKTHFVQAPDSHWLRDEYWNSALKVTLTVLSLLIMRKELRIKSWLDSLTGAACIQNLSSECHSV